MDRIVHSSAVDIGGGRRGFRSKDTVAGVAGTVVTATHMNASQEELVGFIEATGQVPSGADLKQLIRGVRSGRLNYIASVVGTNHLAITLDPAPSSWSELIGTELLLKISNTNTGAADLTIAGLPGTKSIVRLGGAVLIQGDLPAGGLVPVAYDGTNVQLGAVTQGQTGGGQVITATGVTNVVVPDGVFRMYYKIWGAGGGGGGSFNANSSASGGGGGQHRWGSFATVPGETIVVTNGAVGAAGTSGGGNGGAGGSSTIVSPSAGPVVTAPGGGAGLGAAAGTVGAPQFASPGGAGGSGGSGGNAINGLPGGTGFGTTTSSLLAGGQGGAAFLSNPSQVSISGPGVPGVVPGGGGGGASANAAGGAGAPGRTELTW